MALMEMDDRVARADVYNSPGWKRLQSAQSRPVSQPREVRRMAVDAQGESDYEIGDRVFHKKFGYGEVMGTEGDKLIVEFDKAGEKRLLAGFVVPAAEADDVPF